jgi:hypothetical protein
VRKLEKFQISKAPYAILHDTFNVNERWATYTQPDGSSRRGETPYYSMTVEAIWFRRKSGVLTAHVGHLWDSSSDRPADLMAWIENDWDGRYGGNCRARWDGENLWAPGLSWDAAAEVHDILAAALANFPEVPEGFDGWWTYQRPKS